MKIKGASWGSYGHILMVAFLIGLFGAVMTCTQGALQSAENSLGSSLLVVAFLQNSLSEANAPAFIDSLKAQDADIENIDYISKAQAYQEAMKDPKMAKSLMLLKANPLPASLTIRYSERALSERADPAEKVRGANSIQEIRWDPQARSIYRSLHGWRMWMMRFSAFVALVLLVWAFVGLYRLLLLQSTPQEIAVQVGLGLGGGALAWGLWGAGLQSIQSGISMLHPAPVWAVPILMGAVSALGCF